MEKSKQNNIFSATEETPSVAFSDWTRKMVFDWSFTAKLVLSGEKLKGYYADIATELLKYETVTAKTGWSGIYFQAGRERIAFISLSGKTLYLYLAADPSSQPAGKVKAADVSKTHTKTPSMLRIRGENSKNSAIVMIGQMARQKGLTEKANIVPVTASNFKSDSLNNLITRGLVRILADGKDKPTRKLDAYTDTMETTESLLARHGIYQDILNHLAEGDGYARLSQQLLLRSVDEIWVKAVEDCISALDELIRNPNHFIAETEDVLPIERTKRISGRSIAHLGRHTDYLSRGENGDYTPTKMLNIFREDSLLTYENKFLNTLIHRLYAFVNKRYKVASTYGVDEKLERFDFENHFTYGEGKGTIKISIAYSQQNLDADVKNQLSGTGLWNRVERLNNIVTGYINSSFVKSMDRNFVRPPILRTNAIVKNKYFRECLALWEFIESYDDAGYGIIVDEKTEDLSDEYIKSTYRAAATEYLLFRYHAESGFQGEMDEQVSLRPDFVVSDYKARDLTEEFLFEKEELSSNDDLDFVLRVALLADLQMQDTDCPAPFLSKTFDAKIRLAPEELKQTFVEICNEFLKYGKVEMDFHRRYALIHYGMEPLAKITVNGNVIRMYTSLIHKEIPDDFGARTVHKIKALADMPTCFKIDSQRSISIAKEIADMFAIKYELNCTEDPFTTLSVSDYQAQPLVDMLQKGWVHFVKREPAVPHAGVSFGSVKKERAGQMAVAAEKLAVAESRLPENHLDTTGAVDTASEDAQALAKAISGLIRPSGNYEKPTEYGIDDTAAFIRDAAEEKSEAEQHEGQLV